MSHYHDSDDLRILGDTALIAALRAGAAVTHGALALKLFDQVKGDQR